MTLIHKKMIKVIFMLALAPYLLARPVDPQKATTKPVSEMSLLIKDLQSADLEIQGAAIEKLKGRKDKKIALQPLIDLFNAHYMNVDESLTEEQKKKREINFSGVVQLLVNIDDSGTAQYLKDAFAKENDLLSKVFLAWGMASFDQSEGYDALLNWFKDTGAPNKFNTANALREPVGLSCKDLIQKGKMKPEVILEIGKEAMVSLKKENEWMDEIDGENLSTYQLEKIDKRMREQEPLLSAYKNIYQNAFGLLGVTKEGVTLFIQCLHDENYKDFQVGIISFLGLGDDKRAIPELIDIFKNTQDKDIIETAALSLEKLTGQKLGNDANAWVGWWEKEKKIQQSKAKTKPSSRKSTKK